MIDVRDVDVRLGGVRILEDVSAHVDEGRFVGLVGPNGAGKSTLLRTIGAVLSPDAGSVVLDGEDVHDLPSRAASRRVAAVPQDTSLSFDFDVRDVVAMGRTPYRSRLRPGDEGGDAMVARALERTDTEEFADRPIDSVSGGERQRVVLARALAQDTPILLLDEPTASLDINHQLRTLELVRDLVDEGKTVIAAIHDLNLAAHYCDELVLLAEGRVLESGPPERVLTESNLTRAFDTRAVVSRHPVTGAVYVTALPETSSGDREGRVHVIGGGASVSRVLYVLSAAGYETSVGALNEGDSDLETARLLGIEAVAVPPFAPVDEDAREAVRERVASANVVVVGDCEIGEGNLANLECAAESDRLVLVEERPFDERNYAGEDAKRRYERLRSRATVVDTGGVLGAVERAITDEGEV
ncbi:heme ABC transporter ATP-binding protein [Halalkalicoccus ordinarius]|uniref:heme ABC transporter ATP-binding protein n=1 Tax=Halalkalicoccus ordinarius TaxID=3116651 RepID=UPI00300F341E